MPSRPLTSVLLQVLLYEGPGLLWHEDRDCPDFWFRKSTFSQTSAKVVSFVGSIPYRPFPAQQPHFQKTYTRYIDAHFGLGFEKALRTAS